MPQYANDANGIGKIESDTDVTYIAADGNIIVHHKRITHHALDQGGVALALTIDLPVPGADDGKIVTFWSEDTAAHVITQAADGFNAKGAAGTATWAGAAPGESLVLIAHGGHWWTLVKGGVVVA
jgi:hypothetical protein